ncbi:hypothetical protein CPAR01_09909 [Colletotrichum paranaense]|uniref:Uncharacterized protein n=2 Tax=Colletotrichum acutatum species complex TaxID=2707335 RepID=A0AAI9UJL6_9PEZI|nr:uncharacterized protein CPAR01_09909 [Colletotrichum paranaense]XP_060393062.1 uncharacterized protein CABS01_14607 [Colletotrichum abscissum]KAK1458229.1 hypothetical protein CMEL01_15576 [Colletotrichum melonis]KAK1478923.1 hypothetical protein CABS01_14607 [Colletotrichum abscissum]KAK1533201.1 hypothetical protein CPAR01_09909 [Colletotrichum paranaense]
MVEWGRHQRRADITAVTGGDFVRTAVVYGSLNDEREAPKAPAESDEQARDLAEATS